MEKTWIFDIWPCCDAFCLLRLHLLRHLASGPGGCYWNMVNSNTKSEHHQHREVLKTVNFLLPVILVWKNMENKTSLFFLISETCLVFVNICKVENDNVGGVGGQKRQKLGLMCHDQGPSKHMRFWGSSKQMRFQKGKWPPKNLTTKIGLDWLCCLAGKS